MKVIDVTVTSDHVDPGVPHKDKIAKYNVHSVFEHCQGGLWTASGGSRCLSHKLEECDCTKIQGIPERNHRLNRVGRAVTKNFTVRVL